MRSLDEELTDLADHYRWFAQVEAAPVSPGYAELAAAVAEDVEVLAFLGTLPRPKRQANLLPAVRDRLPEPPAEDEARFLLALDGEPLAYTAAHGGRIDWLPAAAPSS